MEPLLVGVLTTAAFTFLIMFMPNTRVQVLPGLAGGLLTAVLFIFWMKLCLAIQIGVANYSTIYGSFAVVPIVLFWIQVSWEIVLLGTETASALQNCTSHSLEMRARAASARSKFVLALAVVREAARAMLGEAPAFETSRFAREKGVPVRILNEVLHELVQAGLLAELRNGAGVYVLLRSPDSIQVKDVFDVMHAANSAVAAAGGSLTPAIQDVLNRMDAGVTASFESMSVRQLAAKS